MSDDPDNHYGDLRGMRMELIEEHRRLKAKVNNDEYDDTYRHQQDQREYDKGKRDGVLEGIQQVEELLREWNDRDDRDGEGND